MAEYFIPSSIDLLGLDSLYLAKKIPASRRLKR